MARGHGIVAGHGVLWPLEVLSPDPRRHRPGLRGAPGRLRDHIFAGLQGRHPSGRPLGPPDPRVSGLLLPLLPDALVDRLPHLRLDPDGQRPVPPAGHPNLPRRMGLAPHQRGLRPGGR